jgi:putative hydrolase of the HAD superfamily
VSRARLDIDAVFFDAGGTLIHAEPAPGAVYAAVGARYGSDVGVGEATARFLGAFRRRQAAGGLRTSEAEEDAFWRGVVAEVLDDVADFEACYRELFAYFARPEAWRADAEAGPVLAALAARGLAVGVCSNFDARLHGIVAGLEALRPAAGRVVVSSEAGWRKPAPAFFAEVTRQAGLAPERVLVVGDDLVNDYEGARAAGLRALLLDPRGRHPTAERVARLAELPALLCESGF